MCIHLEDLRVLARAESNNSRRKKILFKMGPMPRECKGHGAPVEHQTNEWVGSRMTNELDPSRFSFSGLRTCSNIEINFRRSLQPAQVLTAVVDCYWEKGISLVV
jgi:hypothetical protein